MSIIVHSSIFNTPIVLSGGIMGFVSGGSSRKFIGAFENTAIVHTPANLDSSVLVMTFEGVTIV